MTSRVMKTRVAPDFRIQIPPRDLLPCGLAAAAPGANGLYNNKSAARSTFEATQILPGLYLGTYSDATSTDDLEQRNISHVLNLASECPVVDTCHPATGRPITTKHYRLVDSSDEDIARHFSDALDFIHDARSQGNAVLVHCRLGVSRSATIVLAYLMKYGRDKAVNVQQFSPTLRTLPSPQIITSPYSVRARPDDAANPWQGGAGENNNDDEDCHNPRKPDTHMSYADAFDLVKRLRPQVSPNLGFVLALHDFDTANSISRPFSCRDSDITSIPLSSSPESLAHGE